MDHITAARCYLLTSFLTFCLLASTSTSAQESQTDRPRPAASAVGAATPTADNRTEEMPDDPKKASVRLPAMAGWNAHLVIDNGETGIWTVGAFQVFPQYGTPEVVGLDDKGRCHVLVSYSGKWSSKTIIDDGRWLGGLTHGDLDPRIEGAELYTGGQQGNLYQVVAYPHGVLDCRLIAHFPGLEIHTLLAGELDPTSPGAELLVFTRPGALYRVTPDGPHGTFVQNLVSHLPGRVRDALVLPGAPGEPASIATVSRNGRLDRLRLSPSGLRRETVYSDNMGMGRLAMRWAGESAPLVLYASHDDGRIIRLEKTPAQGWSRETIYLGARGPRGIATGVFDEDPEVETLAVFGYSRKVQLLVRGPEGWSVETIFEDRDKGHWLSAAELDGRNGTCEIIGSGYGGRVFLLSRPPGYGLEGVATE